MGVMKRVDLAVATNKEPNTFKIIPDNLLLLGTTNLGCSVLAYDK